jgi:superfamily II DNA or RNA helicase
VRLRLENLHTHLEDGTDDEVHWLSDLLAWEDPRGVYRTGRGRGRPERVNLYDFVNRRFPAGLTSRAALAAKAEGKLVEVVDARAVPATPIAQWGAWLRDYQREAVEACIARTRGIVWAPTGSGKTECLAALVEAFPAANWLFVVHRATLADQALDRVRERLGRDPQNLCCRTLQSLHAELRRGDSSMLTWAHGLVADEAHCMSADTYFRIAMSTPNAYWRIGLSGTPLARGDRRSILTVASLGGVIFRLRPERLIEAGVLARPRITMLPMRVSSGAQTPQGVYGETVVRNAARNAAVVAATKGAPKPALVFVKQIAHGKALVKRLEKARVKCEFVWGEQATEQRQAAVRRLVRGDTEVIVCSVVFQEGLDVPSLRSVVIACGGASTIAAIQRVGRGMRRADGKDEFLVVDFDDQGHRWPERHSRQRRAAYRGEGYEVAGTA